MESKRAWEQEYNSTVVQEFRSACEFECMRVVMSAGIEKSRSAGVQKFRSSGVQKFRSSEVQEFSSSVVQEYMTVWVPECRNPEVHECRSAGVLEYMSAREQYCWNAGAQECRRIEGEKIQKVLIETWCVSCNKMLWCSRLLPKRALHSIYLCNINWSRSHASTPWDWETNRNRTVKGKKIYSSYILNIVVLHWRLKSKKGYLDICLLFSLYACHLFLFSLPTRVVTKWLLKVSEKFVFAKIIYKYVCWFFSYFCKQFLGVTSRQGNIFFLKYKTLVDNYVICLTNRNCRTTCS